MAAPHEAQMPFIKNLASSDRKLRTASLDSLKAFLASRSDLPATDALKLWKGLYYAHWMTDRPAPQQRLAADLARLADDAVPAACQPAWFAAFWDVLGQQWSSIDKHRLDKFLLLARRVLAAQLRQALTSPDVAAGLAEWPFEETGDLRRVPLGLRLHVLDLWVDEMEREGMLGVAADDDDRDDGESRALVGRVGDMVKALRWCPVKQVRERARESYEDERLPWAEGKRGEEAADEDMDDDEWGGIDG